MAAEAGAKAIIAAFVANMGIAAAKFVAFLVTGATSMLAEAIHSVADAANQGLLLLGRRRAREAISPDFPFGHGRERYFWSFIVALVLFTLGGLFSVFEGVNKLLEPHDIESVGWAVGVLAVGIVLEVVSMRTAVVEARPLKGERSWWQFIRESRAPELPVVLLEDLGALVGLVLALAGVVLVAATGDPVYDALATIAIGGLLTVIAVVLSIEMRALLIGEPATRHDVAAIREALSSAPGIRRLLELRTQHLGPADLLVAAKVELARELSFEEVAETIDNAEAMVRERVPAARFLYVEPDLPPTDGG